MKKFMIPVLALLLISILVACSGQGGENTYTGDFDEYNNSSSSSSDNSELSDSGNSNSSLVTVPLTTQAGATVPPVSTTQPTTEFHAVDYTPIVPDTTKPVTNTIYVDQPESTTHNNNLTNPDKSDTTSTTEKTTSGEVKYVDVDTFDTNLEFFGTAESDLLITIKVATSNLKGKPVGSSGSATINVSGNQHKVKYSVKTSRDPDDAVIITIDASNIPITEVDDITVDVPKGAIKTDDNISNKKFRTMVGYY